MDYTVHKLARLAGISTRTLRYYDEIGLLVPPRMNSSGYRYYGQAEVDKLQQIMFYRELGLDLQTIKEILDAPDYNQLAALAEHRDKLLMGASRGRFETTEKLPFLNCLGACLNPILLVSQQPTV